MNWIDPEPKVAPPALEDSGVSRTSDSKAASAVEQPPAKFRFELRPPGPLRLGQPVPKLPLGSKRTSPRALGFMLLAGVILPAVTAVVEYLTGACAQIFFNPVPTRWHVALILFVSLANLAVFSAVVTRRIKAPRFLAGANAVALGIAAVYATLFLPLAPLAIVALFTVVLSGHALLALAPLLSFVATLALRRALRLALPANQSSTRLPPAAWGLALAALAFVLLDARITLTRVGMHWAATGDTALRERGVGMLRIFGDEETLLQACQARRGRSLDILGFLFSLSHPVSPEQARQVYYRVTGEPFEREAQPQPWGLRGVGFDADQGSATVGHVLPGLSLAESHLDGSVDPGAALGYLEWTMVFSNVNPQPVEARAEIQLPPGAVVSRVTLWIDGEEREAAFGGKGQVREAYERVVRARRDPLLVTSTGRDRVLAQCFPVPGGGEMKIRLGVTMPLVTGSGFLALGLPHFLERNFSAPETRHNVWIEAGSPLEAPGKAWRSERAPDGAYALRAALSDAMLEDPAQVLLLKPPAPGQVARNLSLPQPWHSGIAAAWTPDLANPRTSVIRQHLERKARPPVRRLVVVIDGSARMNPHLDAIAAALEAAPKKFDYEILWAADTVERFGANPSRLRDLRAEGGPDSVPALQRAYETASRQRDVAILWIHGPQPVLLEPPGPLQNNWRRRTGSPRLYTLRAVAGKNRVLETLENRPEVIPVPRMGELRHDFIRFFETISHSSAKFAAVRERVERPEEIPRDWGERTSAHLARLWAKDETERLTATGKTEDREQAVRLATAHQIVTAVSGAVVLENQAQYEQANLTPAAGNSVPTIPEPETWALMLITVVLLCAQWLARRRRWKRA
jgi:hypothetical protein